MEVMMPHSSSAVTGDNFMFRSTCTSPCTPQSPQNAGSYFFSAPSSPTNSSPFNRQISFAFDAIAKSQESDHTHHHSDDIAEDTPVDSANLDHGLAKKYFSFNFYVNQDDGDDSSTTKEEDFEFDFTAATQDGGEDGTTNYEDFTFSPTVNQLSQGGIIKSLDPAPPKKTLQNAVSFRQRKKYSDPRAKSMERVHNSPNNDMNGRNLKKSPKALKMVSERVNTKKSCKALSSTPRSEASEQVISMERSSSSSSSWLVKWKLPDLLFRSASEGHETKKKYEIEAKNVKMSSGGSGSNGGSRKKKERVSGQELIYKVNRATAEEMRRKTFLPYKQNLMGCMDNSLILEPSVRGINVSQVRRQ